MSLIKTKNPNPDPIGIKFGFLCFGSIELNVYFLAGIFREGLIKSTRVDGERFFVKARFGKRRNTLCISSFSNRRFGEKDPPSTAEDLFRASLIILPQRAPHIHVFSARLDTAPRSPKADGDTLFIEQYSAVGRTCQAIAALYFAAENAAASRSHPSSSSSISSGLPTVTWCVQRLG